VNCVVSCPSSDMMSNYVGSTDLNRQAKAFSFLGEFFFGANDLVSLLPGDEQEIGGEEDYLGCYYLIF